MWSPASRFGAIEVEVDERSPGARLSLGVLKDEAREQRRLAHAARAVHEQRPGGRARETGVIGELLQLGGAPGEEARIEVAERCDQRGSLQRGEQLSARWQWGHDAVQPVDHTQQMAQLLGRALLSAGRRLSGDECAEEGIQRVGGIARILGARLSQLLARRQPAQGLLAAVVAQHPTVGSVCLASVALQQDRHAILVGGGGQRLQLLGEERRDHGGGFGPGPGLLGGVGVGLVEVPVVVGDDDVELADVDRDGRVGCRAGRLVRLDAFRCGPGEAARQECGQDRAERNASVSLKRAVVRDVHPEQLELAVEAGCSQRSRHGGRRVLELRVISFQDSLGDGEPSLLPQLRNEYAGARARTTRVEHVAERHQPREPAEMPRLACCEILAPGCAFEAEHHQPNSLQEQLAAADNSPSSKETVISSLASCAKDASSETRVR